MPFSEMPPMLRGTEQEQINALRDYLVRLVKGLNEEEPDVKVTEVTLKDGTRAYRRE